jgi:hypothetical protein
MLDAEFKQAPISFPQGWTRHSNGGAIGPDKYHPDLSFADAQGKVVCVIESSSTNDRKAGVGELCIADKFFSDSATDGVLIFSLCGISSNSPRRDTQAAYLSPYFKYLRAANRPHGVKEVYIIAEKDFKLCDWKALSEDFIANACVLKAQANVAHERNRGAVEGGENREEGEDL